jgi:hypothetical protein
MNTADFCARLNSIVPSDDGSHLQALEELTATSTELVGHPEIAAAVFVFLEQNGAVDLGAPGPLVHFVERAFPSYVEALVASLDRHPVGYTLWMANRILNAKIPQQLRVTLLSTLGKAAKHPLSSELERCQAREFIERHTAAG